jgi:tetratricopeptide (TPR) repeat protein
MTEYPSQLINGLRKGGQLDEAWNIGVVEVQKNPNDKYLKGAFFWVCYDYLKAAQKAIMDRGKNNSNFIPLDDEFKRINNFLNWVIWLDIPPGGLEYPRLLSWFRKNLEHFPQLVSLLIRHQELLFTEEEKKPFFGENGESPSLMLTCARKAAKSWMERANLFSFNVDDVIRFLKATRSQTTDQKNKIWLDYDEAKCLIIAQRYNEARTFVIPVLKEKNRESWAWGALAATYQKQDPEASIRLFSQGLSCVHDDTFALKLLKGLAPLLATKGQTKEASMCVKRAVKCYQDNGWKLKDDLNMLLNQSWFDSEVDENMLKPFINNIKQGALDYLYDKLEKIKGELKITDKGFGFVGDTFIPPKLAKKEFSGQTVEVLRYRDIDKVKNRMGWKALAVTPVNQE